MKAFSWLMQDVRKGDVLFFHFSGHGGQVPDKTGHEADGWNETVIPVDHDRAGQITDDVLFGTLVYKLPGEFLYFHDPSSAARYPLTLQRQKAQG